MDYSKYIGKYMEEVKEIADKIDQKQVESVIKTILETKKSNGRIFFLGLGGGAANSSHAVNDFRKIACIESYSAMENISELTARINDDGWDIVFSNWLAGSKLNNSDCVFVFSVGGGNEDKQISTNIVEALKYAKKMEAKIVGIVGRDGGYTKKVASACISIPIINNETVTPHTEAFQSVISHLIVSHPAVKSCEMKWESVK